jgi:CRISPR-associated endonuclease/helicase Cas3
VLLKPWKLIEEKLCWTNDEINSLLSTPKSLHISPFELFFLAILFRGLILCSDHLASAGYTQIKTIPTNFVEIIQKQKPTWTLNYIQEKANKYLGDCFLFAPTAYGKTEAGLLWANNNSIDSGERIFFVLPYTASCNKMFDRLAGYYGMDNVGILHSKTQAFLFDYFGRGIEENNPKNTERIKNMIKVMSKNYLPIKIITPFQILKLFYGYNGYEANLIEFLNAKLIFDEIHVYDPSTMAQIIVSVRFLKFIFNVKFLFMTATMPKFLRTEFQSALNNLNSKESTNLINPICLPEELLKNRIRHKIKIVNSSIIEEDQLNPLLSSKIKDDLIQSKRILIVCNSVVIAKRVYSLINEEFCVNDQLIKKDQIGLIHGGLIQRDRIKVEDKLDQYLILIGTQAIEVSLDIDYNVGYFELAPLDAIIQRAGRINRTGKRKNPEPILVFSEDSLLKQSSFSIYSKSRISLSKKILSDFIDNKHNRISDDDFALVSDYDYNELVEKLYIDGYDTEEKMIFDSTKCNFENFINNYMRPFQADSNLYQQFEELFDSITVLPEKFLEQYQAMIFSNEYYTATELTLNISKRKYAFFKKKNLTEYIADLKIVVLKVEYKDKWGIDD